MLALQAAALAASVDMLRGRTLDIVVDDLPGTQHVRTSAVGRREPASSDASPVLFAGRLNTNGNGHAFITVGGGNGSGVMDLSAGGSSGLLLEFDTMPHAKYGLESAAPVPFTIQLEGDERCSRLAAFAVPKTASAERTQAWLPFSRFAPRGVRSDYTIKSTGIPAACTDEATTPIARVARYSIGLCELHRRAKTSDSLHRNKPARIPA